MEQVAPGSSVDRLPLMGLQALLVGINMQCAGSVLVLFECERSRNAEHQSQQEISRSSK